MISGKRKYVRWWLWSGAFLIFVLVVVGGITRLTDSGLSMSDWNLIMGAIPPMNEAEWMAAFERYKEFPQYQQVNAGMPMEEFKTIFFWEYTHRLLGRVIGVVFLIPFAFFWIRGYFNPGILRRLLFLFGLGALQGVMGWIMVKSGLADVPYISHYRLAIHLVLAMAIFGLCIWFALEFRNTSAGKKSKDFVSLKRWSIGLMVIFTAQVVWGAFTAGLDAGYIYNTFPMMNGEWHPRNAWELRPAIINLVDNPGTVQWMHRILGTILLLITAGLWWRNHRSDLSRRLKQKARLLLVMVLIQFILGIFTVISSVQILTGIVHQCGSLIVLFLWIRYHHDLKQIEKNPGWFKIR